MTVENLEANGNQANQEEKTDSGAIKLAVANANLPGNRPVQASKLKVVDTYKSVGGTRPIVKSGLDVSGTLAISGNRPIAVSHLQVSETYTVMGNRPVASNQIDEEPAVLMGYLD
ncbi:MAG: hypothetical protein D6756_00870 [Cyanobacteria bacterium J083]|nr:MAG: hypothetical protein D6756_00870 [Cyanobacteria bacterium J083]